MPLVVVAEASIPLWLSAIMSGEVGTAFSFNGEPLSLANRAMTPAACRLTMRSTGHNRRTAVSSSFGIGAVLAMTLLRITPD